MMRRLSRIALAIVAGVLLYGLSFGPACRLCQEGYFDDRQTWIAYRPMTWLYVRGPNIMLGYLNLPEATAQSIDAEGWYHTGDIGYADEQGYFFVVDRLKELIKYSGYQVAPAELEAVLVSHPAIAEAAVIPSPDEEHGEIPKAFVVRRGELSEQDVMDYVAARVAPFKKVRLVEFIDQIPKSPTGKILRRELRERERRRIGAG